MRSALFRSHCAITFAKTTDIFVGPLVALPIISRTSPIHTENYRQDVHCRKQFEVIQLSNSIFDLLITLGKESRYNFISIKIQ